MDILGKKKLREQIQQLQDELAETQDVLRETEQELDRYRQKFQEAETEKQEVCKEKNQLEQRLEQLENLLEYTNNAEAELQRIMDTDTMVRGLQDIEFMTADAYTAYLPDDNAVVTEGRHEIVFFDPATTGVAVYPPIPIDEEVTTARTFQIEQLQRILSGPYLYLHLSRNGSGAAIIRDGNVQEFMSLDAPDAEAVLADIEELQESSFRTGIVSGEDELVEQFLSAVDQPFVRLRTKVPGVSSEQDMEQAFDAAFTVEYRRLTEEDVESLREHVF